MTGVQTIPVTSEEVGLRLDRWFARHFPQVGHGRLEKWLRTGQVRIDGGRAKAGARLEAGQSIRIPPLDLNKGSESRDTTRPRAEPKIDTRAASREAASLTVLHRDARILVIDKPAGLAVQGGTNTTRHLDAMLDHLRFDADERPRLVHRLDRDTSGVLVLARTAAVAARLAEVFRSREVEKLYWGVVVGLPRIEAGVIDLPVAKRPGRGGERMEAGAEGGLRAETLYRIIDHAGRRAAWLALEPRTGRTHQLRVHCAAMGTPILGDGKYGGREAFLEGLDTRVLHLHARALRLPHPDGGVLEVRAPLPPHMGATFRFLGFSAGDPDAGFATACAIDGACRIV